MMIDKSCINSKTLQMIRDIVANIYVIVDAENKEEERGNMLMTLGEISGIIRLAEELYKAADE